VTKSVHALFVHGIGQQDSKFADQAQKRLAAALSPRGVTLYGRSVHWAPLLDTVEAKALRQTKRLGAHGKLMQRVTMGTLADALSYRHHQVGINYLMDYETKQLRADEIHIFGHSLGCLLVADYLRSRTGVKVAHLYTMGCNLQLFFLGAEDQFDCPQQLKATGKWTNLFSPNDAIGFPLRAWLPQVRDVEVSVGNIFTKWWGAAHGAYWGDKRLWSDTIPGLLLGET
jgi:pimeloyl-ACP methyl ester carboxylesterase